MSAPNTSIIETACVNHVLTLQWDMLYDPHQDNFVAF